MIHGGVGAINESDVMLAATSNAIIVGFNVRPDNAARDSIARSKVDVRMYRVIYDAIDEIKAAMKGMLAPKFREAAIGQAEIRQVYKVSGVGSIAGCYVEEGKIRDAIRNIYRNASKDAVSGVLKNVDISGMIEEKINNMKTEELEKVVLTVMKKELDTIVNLGALIGFILGSLNTII